MDVGKDGEDPNSGNSYNAFQILHHLIKQF